MKGKGLSARSLLFEASLAEAFLDEEKKEMRPLARVSWQAALPCFSRVAHCSSLALVPKDVHLKIHTCDVEDEHFILITAEPPDTSARRPTDVTIVIDKSGLMAKAATVTPDGDGDDGEDIGEGRYILLTE